MTSWPVRACGRMKAVVVLAVACLAATLAATFTGRAAAPLPDVSERVEQTLAGLFYHYWRYDPKAKTEIGYFFDCSQVGNLGDSKHCTCENAKACTACYRWWDAVALEAIANHGIYTNTTTNASVADMIWAHSPYNQNWTGTLACQCPCVEDFVWYSMAYLRVYEWLKVSRCGFSLRCLYNNKSMFLYIAGARVADPVR